VCIPSIDYSLPGPLRPAAIIIPTVSRPCPRTLPPGRHRLQILAIQRHLNHGNRTLQSLSPHRPRHPWGGTLLGYDVGEVGVEGPPTLDWLWEDASETDDKAASLVSIDPEVDRERSLGQRLGEGLRMRVQARKALAY
jgi:hypothetical protein